MCSELSKLLEIKKWQMQDKKFKSFLKQTSEVFIKTFCRKWEGERKSSFHVILHL